MKRCIWVSSFASICKSYLTAIGVQWRFLWWGKRPNLSSCLSQILQCNICTVSTFIQDFFLWHIKSIGFCAFSRGKLIWYFAVLSHFSFKEYEFCDLIWWLIRYNKMEHNEWFLCHQSVTLSVGDSAYFQFSLTMINYVRVYLDFRSQVPKWLILITINWIGQIILKWKEVKRYKIQTPSLVWSVNSNLSASFVTGKRWQARSTIMKSIWNIFCQEIYKARLSHHYEMVLSPVGGSHFLI